jgi:hypothetical protein
VLSTTDLFDVAELGEADEAPTEPGPV